MLHMDEQGELFEAPPNVVTLRACTWCPNLTPNEPNSRGDVWCDKCQDDMEKSFGC